MAASARPAIMKAIEGELDSPRLERKGGSVTVTDFKTPYVAAIKNFVDLKLIEKAGFKFAIDVMYGAGRGVVKGIFTEAGIHHFEIRGELNPLFPGINPEPIEPHIAMLQETVVHAHCQAGMATDRRRRPHRGSRGRRQLRGCAQDLLRDPGVAAEAQEVAGRDCAGVQRRTACWIASPQSTAASCTSAASASSTSAT